MNEISVQEIGQDPEAFLRRLEAGELIVLVRDEKPVAEIRPLPPRVAGLRPYGLCAGEFTVPADFDAPLPDELLKDFEG